MTARKPGSSAHSGQHGQSGVSTVQTNRLMRLCLAYVKITFTYLYYWAFNQNVIQRPALGFPKYSSLWLAGYIDPKTLTSACSCLGTSGDIFPDNHQPHFIRWLRNQTVDDEAGKTS